MKARNMALIGMGVLAAGGVTLYFLKSKGIIGDNVNSGGFTFITAEEAQKVMDNRIEASNRLGIELPKIQVVDSAYGQQQLAILKEKYPSSFSGIENLIL